MRHSASGCYDAIRTALILASVLVLGEVVASEPCSFCKYLVENQGEDIEETLIIRDKPLDFVPDLVGSCGELYDLTIDMEASDLQCGLVQSISTLCGCPAREEACSLCGEGLSLSAQGLEAHVPLPKDLAMAAVVLGVEPDDTLTVSCELIQAYAQSRKEGRQKCVDIQLDFALPCQCKPIMSISTIPEVDNSTISNPEDGGDEGPSCRFCRNNGTTPVPEKDLSHLIPVMTHEERVLWEEYSNQTGTSNLTCGSLKLSGQHGPKDTTIANRFGARP